MSEKKKIINIFEHILVPQHIRLTQEEADKILAKYRIYPYYLPHILASDPAVKAIKAIPGEIIKIERKSLTAGETIAYRYVVEE